MRLLCFGEIVWDEIGGQRFIGGGPFNVAAHAKILGVDEVFLFSAVGHDPLGETTRDVIHRSGVDDSFVKTVASDTCVVKATLDQRGNATFTIPDPTSFDQIEATDEDIERIRALKFHAIYFGTIAQRRAITRASLRRLVERGGFQHVFCDINLRMNFYDAEVLGWSFHHSDTLKLNEEEAVEVRRLCGIAEEDRQVFCNRLQQDFGIRWVCLTGGEKGAWVCSPEAFSYHPAAKVDIVDTIGAGDAFAAAMIRTLYADHSPTDACQFACRVGGLVASRRGAVPHYDPSEVSLPSPG
jgi:fructokinase